MYVCVCVCLSVRVCVCLSVLCVCACVCLSACDVCVYVYIYACMCVYTRSTSLKSYKSSLVTLFRLYASLMKRPAHPNVKSEYHPAESSGEGPPLVFFLALGSPCVVVGLMRGLTGNAKPTLGEGTMEGVTALGDVGDLGLLLMLLLLFGCVGVFAAAVVSAVDTVGTVGITADI